MKKLILGLSIASVIALNINAMAEDMKMDAKDHMAMTKTAPAMKTMAKAEIKNSAGVKIGMATFLPLPKGVKISVQVMGLTAGVHGIHIHEFGKCDDPKFKSAGGHFNPAKHKHGLSNPKGYHNGDMKSITIDKNGNGSIIIDNYMVSTGSGVDSLLKSGGTSIVIHAKADDQKTDPSGNSGDRLGCGVIEAL